MRGGREDDFGDARHDLPRVAEVESGICASIDALGYDPEVRDRFRGAVRSRFIRMSRGSVGRLFDCEYSLPSITQICSSQTIIELAALSPHEANLVSMFLLTSIREHMSGLEDFKQPQASDGVGGGTQLGSVCSRSAR